MATIFVDGVSYEVRDGANLLHACLSQGLDLPYFCWHPSLGSVGACRQCAVVQYKDEEDTRGKLTMACMTPAIDGIRLSIRADEAVQFRALVIEWLMMNHPHDCPVCEEGGECHLQDMTVMTGHTFRRYRGRKRTFQNQYLGPFLTHEMNRCITCYRCVRYYRDYAGGRDLDAFGSRDRLYFGRAEDGVLESAFAGNLVEVCPTGVFTDKTFSATYTRKWDLGSAPSICHGCGLGCNTLPGERYGLLKRVHNRYHGEVNGYFLCDRGRFGAGFVNDQARIRQCGIRRDDGSFDPVPPEEALGRAAEWLRGRRVAGIGSPRASLESNFALQRLVGAEHFWPGLADHEADVVSAVLSACSRDGVRIPSLKEVEAADAVLVLGEDVSNSAPRLALALRQTVRNRSFAVAAKAGIPLWQDAGVRGHAGQLLTPLFQATALPTGLDDVSQASLHAVPDDLARLGHAIAHRLGAAEDVPGLVAEHEQFAAAVAEVLAAAERPLVVSGTGAGSAAVVEAAGGIARALVGSGRNATLCLTVPECNTMGAALLSAERRLGDLLDRLERGEVDTLVVLENELTRRAEPARIERAMAKTRVIVLDALEGWTPEHADVVLPAATFAESDGTWINNELRAQRFFRVFPAAAPVAPSWQWVAALAEAVGSDAAERLAGLRHAHALLDALAGERPDLAPATEAAPGIQFRLPSGHRVPRQPHRFSGRTAMHADRSVHEPKPPVDEESPLAFSMEGAVPQDPGALLPFTWSPGWNSNQSIFKFQAEVGGALRGGPAGVRLTAERIRHSANGTAAPVPPAYRPEDGFLVVPLQEVFASDELSSRTPAVRQRCPAPYLVISQSDAERLGVTAGDGIRLDHGDSRESFAARIEPAMQPGAVGVVQGMAEAVWVVPGARVRVTADPDYVPPSDGVIARG